MKLADLPQVRSLSTREKLQLADELWREVAHHLDSLEVTRGEKQILDKRWAAFVRNPGSALTLGEFKDRVKKLRS